jgi:glycine reductase
MEDAYFARDMLRNEFVEKTAAERGVEMLLAKIKGRPFQTEIEGEKSRAVEPPAPIEDLASSEIALISDGGIVPKGNPDRFKSRANAVWAAYQIGKLFPESSSSFDIDIAHTGYHAVYVMEDPCRLAPVDALRDMERKGIIRKLHSMFYSTSGNATQQRDCMKMGKEIAEELKNKGVNGAILTST